MGISGVPQLSQSNLMVKAETLPILPETGGTLGGASTSNAGNAGQAISVTPDLLLYDAFNSLLLGGGTGSTSNGGGFQSTPNFGARPEDLAYAQALYGTNPLLAYQSVSSYLTLGNFLPGFGAGNTTGGQTTQQSPGDFNSYKANFLGNMTPQGAIDLANLLAGPFLQ